MKYLLSRTAGPGQPDEEETKSMPLIASSNIMFCFFFTPQCFMSKCLSFEGMATEKVFYCCPLSLYHTNKHTQTQTHICQAGASTRTWTGWGPWGVEVKGLLCWYLVARSVTLPSLGPSKWKSIQSSVPPGTVYRDTFAALSLW